LAPEAQRKINFINTVKEWVEHNSDDKSTYVKGINSFADMTNQEFFDYF